MINKNSITPIRILQITDNINSGGGIMNVIVNWHRNIDRTKIQFDYLYFKDSYPNYELEIKELGGTCYKIPYPQLKKPWEFFLAIKKFFKTHKYNTIHSHMEPFSFPFFLLAKFYGISNIIQHTHNSQLEENKIKNLRNNILFDFAKPFITKKLACSSFAGKKILKKNYKVISNGIDTEIFKFNNEIRNNIRKDFNIEHKFVVGNVGRITIQKNTLFLIDIFNEIYKQKKDSVLLLIGDGNLQEKVKEKIKNLNLTDNVIAFNFRKDIEKMYQAMDCFVFPSVFEGFGLAAVEAQSCGLPCFISDKVPEDAIICNAIKIPLSKSSKQWADIILKESNNFERKDCSETIKKAGFDIKDTTKQIEKFYLDL
jgi:glycosyltransferase involved in cell wall biosynthesis